MSTTCTKCNNDKGGQKNTQPQPKPHECMLMMQDGRSFTDYRPRCTIQYQMKNENMKNSYDSRMFLMNNAEKMMQVNRDIVEEKNACNTCFNHNQIGTMLPEKNFVKCDKNTCVHNNNVNPNGLGTGRIFK